MYLENHLQRLDGWQQSLTQRPHQGLVQLVASAFWYRTSKTMENKKYK